MKAIINFSELVSYVKKNFNIEVGLKSVDQNSIMVSYDPGMFAPTINIQVNVDSMEDGTICLSYECAKVLSLVISGALNYLRDKLPHEIEFDTSKQTVTVYLKRFKELQEVLQYLTLSDISFGDRTIELTVKLK